jgi:menaquinone reductase, multiheme cytochrome c subunit
MNNGVIFFLGGLIAALVFGWLIFPSLMYETIEQPFSFSHVTHTDLAGMTCSDCHYVQPDGRFNGIPKNATCEMCHSGQIGETEDERIFVEEYLSQGTEVPWYVYSRQPENVYFPHTAHISLGEVSCETCHGDHDTTETLRPFQRNRISGYSRDIWGPSITRTRNPEGRGMKMNDCIRCHETNDFLIGCIGCHK